MTINQKFPTKWFHLNCALIWYDFLPNFISTHTTLLPLISPQPRSYRSDNFYPFLYLNPNFTLIPSSIHPNFNPYSAFWIWVYPQNPQFHPNLFYPHSNFTQRVWTQPWPDPNMSLTHPEPTWSVCVKWLPIPSFCLVNINLFDFYYCGNIDLFCYFINCL